MEIITSSLIDALLDCINILPFLLVTYIFLEWLENKASSKITEKIEKHSKIQVLLGSLFGIVPQCGFSSISSSLYATRIITLGTLISVYLTTSDEMIPVLMAKSVSVNEIVKILAIKLIIGLIVGFTLDLIVKKKEKIDIEHFCIEENCHCHDGHDHNNLIVSALKHTTKIFIYIFIITFLLNVIIETIGLNTIGLYLNNNQFTSLLSIILIGLIPNCASSIVISELYVSNVITLGTLIAGLLVNSGVGLAVLFRVNKNLKENLMIISILIITAFISGIILNLI